jgi:uncharacterized membrane protein HdeD (DUF308 family)
MTATDPLENVVHDFALNAKNLGTSAINGIRLAFGIGGIVAVILGIVLLVWPEKTLGVVAIFLGIYFLVAGVIRLALGIFSKGISGGMRTLDILLGILLIVGGIIVLKNVGPATAALLILTVAVIGVGWIIEGVLSIVESRGAPSSGWAITSGIISILAGIVVLVIPGWSALWLILITGIILIVLGILGIIRAFTFGREVRKAAAA